VLGRLELGNLLGVVSMEPLLEEGSIEPADK
jgi:hypothetical protein